MYKFFYTIFSDKYSAYTFLALILAYVVFFAYFRGKEIFNIPLDWISISIIIPIFVVDGIKILLESLVHKKYYQAVEDLSKVTVIIPTKDGEDTLYPTLTSLLKRFPAKSIIVASNGTTDRTEIIANHCGVRLYNIEKAVGKVTAINMALDQVTTPYTLIMDDDTLLGEAILPTNVLDQGFEAAAFKVLPVKAGWLSVLQAHEYRKSMDIGRCYHNKQASVQSVSGAIGLFHTAELKRQIKLHTGEFSGEDLQRTLLVLVSKTRKGVVIVDSVVETMVPGTLGELFNQRILGWNPGYVANLKLYLHLMFAKKVNFKLRFEAMYSILVIVLLDPLRLISLPVLLLSPAYFLIFFVAYVILETIPWFTLGRKEPYWVVLLAPFYGLMNFIARMASLASFTFRRLAYFIARAEKFDDYRQAHLNIRLLSFLLTITIYSSLMGGYSLLRILPKQISNIPIVASEAQVINYEGVGVVEASIIATDSTIPSEYEYTVKSGDSLWRLFDNVITVYEKEQDLTMNQKTRQQLINELVLASGEVHLRKGEAYSVSQETIEKHLSELN